MSVVLCIDTTFEGASYETDYIDVSGYKRLRFASNSTSNMKIEIIKSYDKVNVGPIAIVKLIKLTWRTDRDEVLFPFIKVRVTNEEGNIPNPKFYLRMLGDPVHKCCSAITTVSEDNVPVMMSPAQSPLPAPLSSPVPQPAFQLSLDKFDPKKVNSPYKRSSAVQKKSTEGPLPNLILPGSMLYAVTSNKLSCIPRPVDESTYVLTFSDGAPKWVLKDSC